MSNRHLIRSIVLQSLFEWDFKDNVINMDNVLQYNIDCFAPSLSFKDDFLQFLTKGVTRNCKKIDKIIKIYAPEWPLNQISYIDRNILRLSIFELVYNSSTPYKVVINEAIELAKNFSGEKSSKFINGVLGSIVKDLYKNIKKENEIRFIIKNLDNSYLCINQDDKVKFFRINNDIKDISDKESDKFFFDTLEKEIKEEEEKKEEITEAEISKDKNNFKEDIIESDELDSEKEFNIDDSEIDKKSLEFATNEFNKTFGDAQQISFVDSITCSSITTEDKKALFPNMVLKNVFFVLVQLNKDIKLPDNNFVWVDKNTMLSSIEYKNIKNSLLKIIK